MRKAAAAVLLLLMLWGLHLFGKPAYTAYRQDAAISGEVQSFLELHPYVGEGNAGEETEAPVPEAPYSDLQNAIRTYNSRIYRDAQKDLCSPEAYEKAPLNLRDYGFPGEVFGVLRIPAISVELPIYLGASEDNLMKGVCVMGQTSIPIGGENTNAVLAGHRGWDGVGYLVNIDKISLGDEIYITNPWETLCYKVVEIKIIAPDDVEAIYIKEGKDSITLLTCHPYRSGGRQRYLVICDRVQTVSEDKI